MVHDLHDLSKRNPFSSWGKGYGRGTVKVSRNSQGGKDPSRRDFDDSPTYMHVVMLISRSSIGEGGAGSNFAKRRGRVQCERSLLSTSIFSSRFRVFEGRVAFFFARITTSRVLRDNNNNRDRYAGWKRCNSSGKFVGNDGKDSSCESRHLDSIRETDLLFEQCSCVSSAGNLNCLQDF